ncbi:DNA damage-inducible protein 1 [Mortierella alpina]|nr:DNA damage-inducible protein 1 [Mortierella alpina]
MRISILTDQGELHTIEVDSQMELENIKALLEADCNIPAEEQVLFHNEVELEDAKSTLEGNNVAQDDILTLRRRVKKQRTTNIATIGSGARTGGGPSVHPGQISQGGGDPHNAEQIRQHLISNPAMLRQLQETQPELAEAAQNNPNRFHEMIRELDVQRRSAESARLQEIILISKVPTAKIHMGKKVVSLTQESEAQKVHRNDQHQYPVSVTCADGTPFFGDIVVGADGAYSATRQLLYQQIEDDFAVLSASNTASTASPEESPMIEPLPPSDKEVLSFTSTCLVGQTNAGLDREKFSFDKDAQLIAFANLQPTMYILQWSVFSMPDDSICWMVTEHLGETLPSPAVTTILSTSRPASPLPHAAEASAPSPPVSPTSSVSSSNHPSSSSSASDESYLSSEWGPHRVEMMCDRVGKFPIPCGPGLTIQDLIDNTDKDKISKVMLEEKLFETWSYGRVVLIGDACHKMHPSAGLGAVAAIQDAAVLSDLLFHLPVRASLQDITNAFESYREDRYPIAQQSYEARYQMSHLNEQSWISNFIRKVMNNLPKWIWYRALDRLYEYRPQVSFLPKVDDRGDVPPLPQSYYYCPA